MDRSRHALLPAALYMALVAYFLCASPYALTDFPLDDAWIHQVYAQALAAGHGFAFNPGQPEAGATSPLWVVITAPAHWLAWLGPRAVTAAVKMIGVALGLISLLLVQRIARILSGSGAIATIAALLFLCEPRLVFSALSGMESALLFALLAGGFLGMLTRRWSVASVCFGLAPVARPEAVLLLPLYALVLFLRRGQDEEARKLRTWIFPVIPTLLWSVECLALSGHPLPTTFYLKAEPFHLHAAEIRTAWTILTQHGPAGTPLLFVGLAALVSWTYRTGRGRAMSVALFAVLFPLIFACAVTGSRAVDPDGYYWTRWIEPVALVLSAAASIGVALIVGAALERRRFMDALPGLGGRPATLYAVSGAGLLVVVLALPSLARSIEDRRFHLWSDARAVHLVDVAVGEWIDRTLPRDATVGVNDAGAIRYFGKRRTLDLKKLNYADFAFGRIRATQVIGQTDWLAVFPDWFGRSNLFEYFEERGAFTVPLAEYTVCDCPEQTSTVLYEKRAEFRLGSARADRGDDARRR